MLALISTPVTLQINKSVATLIVHFCVIVTLVSHWTQISQHVSILMNAIMVHVKAKPCRRQSVTIRLEVMLVFARLITFSQVILAYEMIIVHLQTKTIAVWMPSVSLMKAQLQDLFACVMRAMKVMELIAQILTSVHSYHQYVVHHKHVMIMFLDMIVSAIRVLNKQMIPL